MPISKIFKMWSDGNICLRHHKRDFVIGIPTTCMFYIALILALNIFILNKGLVKNITRIGSCRQSHHFARHRRCRRIDKPAMFCCLDIDGMGTIRIHNRYGQVKTIISRATTRLETEHDIFTCAQFFRNIPSAIRIGRKP